MASYPRTGRPARQAGVRQTSRVPLPEPLPTTYSVVLDGGRVRQREVGPADLDDAWAWSSDERFFRYLPVKRHATREAERVWLESVIAEATLSPRRQYELGIELAETASLVGMARIGVDSERHRSANIGYGVAPAFWSRGIALEAAALIIGFGFDRLGMHRIWATHHPDNVVSRRVLDKLGFRAKGRRREDRMSSGRWHDSVVCSLLEDEWRELLSSDAG
jgi:[ribosomal protein S5]-alanine N-acetyltransferase